MTAVSGSGSDPPQPRTPPPPPPPPAPGRAAGVPPPPASHLADPHGLAVAAGRLSAGARRSGRVALAVLAAVLQGDEAVAVVVQGRFRGEIGVAALSAQRVVLVNDRQWKPEVETYDVRPSLQAQGWQDDRTASLTFVDGDRHEVIDRIGDRPLAVELAHRLRQLVASAGGPVPRPPPPPG